MGLEMCILAKIQFMVRLFCENVNRMFPFKTVRINQLQTFSLSLWYIDMYITVQKCCCIDASLKLAFIYQKYSKI